MVSSPHKWANKNILCQYNLTKYIQVKHLYLNICLKVQYTKLIHDYKIELLDKQFYVISVIKVLYDTNKMHLWWLPEGDHKSGLIWS